MKVGHYDNVRGDMRDPCVSYTTGGKYKNAVQDEILMFPHCDMAAAAARSPQHRSLMSPRRLESQRRVKIEDSQLI